MKHLIVASTFALTVLFAASASAQTVEYGKDRPGSDITNFVMPANGSPENCQGACEATASCVAWTFVRAGWQGPAPRCWVKHQVPAQVDSFCCASGHK